MRELMVALVRSLIKNGVKAPADVISFVEDNGRFTGDVSTVILDFSEHDKKVAKEKDSQMELLKNINKVWIDTAERLSAEKMELSKTVECLESIAKLKVQEAEKQSEENKVLKRKIEDLESIIADGKKPDISVSENGVSVGCECGGYHLAKERIAELEDRHQSDCIRINQLLVTIDVLTERYQKLREVHGL